MRSEHNIEIKLGTSYPRRCPRCAGMTPLYHPNVSEIGMVCLGAYGTHWAPGLMLDELCIMLWDIARYHNYDLEAPIIERPALGLEPEKIQLPARPAAAPRPEGALWQDSNPANPNGRRARARRRAALQ